MSRVLWAVLMLMQNQGVEKREPFGSTLHAAGQKVLPLGITQKHEAVVLFAPARRSCVVCGA